MIINSFLQWKLNTKTYHFSNQAADLERLKVLLEHGGIYLDLDVLVIKSFDALRYYGIINSWLKTIFIKI